MKYLPILEELFASDTVIFMMIGGAVAVIIGWQLKQAKKHMMAIMISIATYVICELVFNIYMHIHTNFMLELILLFIGTVSIGCCIGFISCFFVYCLLKWRMPH